MNSEDSRWVRGLKDGNERAFSEFFSRYRAKIYHLALKIVKDPMEAEEVVQEVMLTVFRRVDSFQGQSRLSTWVYRVTVNAALMRLRTRKRENSRRIEDSFLEPEDSPAGSRAGSDGHPCASPAEQPEQELSRKELRERLALALSEMAPEKRRTFLLKNLYGLSDLELSRLVQLSVPALKSQLYRSRAFLRKRLQEYVQQNLAA
jgi:RNA polymerase sigma-70 factor (ECF subfamily)